MPIIEAKYQDVVACILVKKNKILISTRPYPKIFHGYYEFPGGKVSSGEFFIRISLQRTKGGVRLRNRFTKSNFFN